MFVCREVRLEVTKSANIHQNIHTKEKVRTHLVVGSYNSLVAEVEGFVASEARVSEVQRSATLFRHPDTEAKTGEAKRSMRKGNE